MRVCEGMWEGGEVRVWEGVDVCVGSEGVSIWGGEVH